MPNDIPLGLRIAIIDRAFKRRMDERARAMGLTAVQLRVLAEIDWRESEGAEEIHQNDLEQAERVSHPAMTGILQRLEQKGFIVCAPGRLDRRCKRVACTKKAVGVHRALEAQDREVLAELCAGLTPEEAEAFVSITDRIVRGLDLKN